MELSKDLRADFRMIHLFYTEFEVSGIKVSKSELDQNNFLIKVKQKIRNTLKEQERAKERNIYHWHYPRYDSRWCKIVYDNLPSEDEIKEYINEEWQSWYNPFEDGRDCTGVWFTVSIYVFPIKKENKTIVYHFQECDV